MSVRQVPRDDAEACALITQAHARTFAAASRFLPAEKRRAAYAVYTFCRVADDIVDQGSGSAAEVTRALERHRGALIGALRGEGRTAPFRELAWAVRRFDIPATPFHELLNMLRGDVAPVETKSWDDLARYCGGVASTVGEMCAHVFGVPGATQERARALHHARTLGVAMQLTNVLRDVGEDAARGRCYLPSEDLQRFGFTRDDVLERRIVPTDERWIALMQFQIARARALYADAAPGLQLLDADARCCASICAWGYAAILGAIERRGHDSLSGRARIGGVRKSVIALRAWQSTRFPIPRTFVALHRGVGDSGARA